MTPSPDYDTGPTPMTDTNTAAALSAGEGQPTFAMVWLNRGAYPETLIGALNGFITGGSGRCLEALEEMGVSVMRRDPTPAPAALEGSSLGEGEAMAGLLDVFERPFTDPDDPRLKCAQVLTKAEAEAVLEHRGNLIEALQPSSAADAKPVAWRWTSDLWSAGGWRYSTEKPDPKRYHGKITIRALYDQLVGAASDGHRHTAIMEAIRKDIVRQHPGAFTEDSDAEIVIPVGAVPVTLYVKIDVSALAEAVLPLYAQPHPSQQAGAEGREKVARMLHDEYGPATENWPRAQQEKWLKNADAILAALKPVEG